MPTISRRKLLLGASALALAAAEASPALAIVCANCSTIWQQLMEYAQQVYSNGVQLQQYRTQILQYMNMVQNTATLSQHLWNFVTSDIQQIKTLANIGALFSRNAVDITSKLASITAAATQVLTL